MSGAALNVELGGLSLASPVVLAAGAAGYVDELAEVVDLSRVGAVVAKSLTRQPRQGNPTWRLVETPCGMLNAIGLANVGVERFCREHAPRIARCPCRVIGSVAGHSLDEYAFVAGRLAAVEGLAAIEVNVSCPNVAGGRQFGDTAQGVREATAAVVEQAGGRAVFVKLPPVTTGAPGASIVDLAGAALEAGAAGLTIANTMPAMAVDVESRRPRLSTWTGGYSGPGMHPVTLALVWRVHRELGGPPIMAAGGTLAWQDAAAHILAGASAVQLGAGLFIDPRAPGRVVRGLARWMRRQGVSSLAQLVGALEPPEAEGA